MSEIKLKFFAKDLERSMNLPLDSYHRNKITDNTIKELILQGKIPVFPKFKKQKNDK